MKNRILPMLLACLMGVPPCGRLWARTAAQYYREGNEYFRSRSYERAVPYFQSALRENPSDWRSYQMLGTCYIHLGQIPEALGAYDKSLELHPDNPVLRDYVEKLRPARPPSAVSLEPKVKKASTAVNPTLEKNPLCLRLSGGLGYDRFLDDLNQASNAFASQANGQASRVDLPYLVLEGNAELDLSLDSRNALGLFAGTGKELLTNGVFEAKYGDFSPDGFTGVDQYVDLYVVSAGIRYYRFLPDKDGRWFISAGAGYYQVQAAYHYEDNRGSTPILAYNNNLSGNTFGFTLAAGREIPLFGPLGLEVGVEGRYANVPKLAGPGPNGAGTQTLVTDLDGGIDLVPEGSTGGLPYLPINLTGVRMDLGLNLYF